MKSNRQEILFEKYLDGKASESEIKELMFLIDEAGTEPLEASSAKIWNNAGFISTMNPQEGDRLKSKVFNSLGHKVEERRHKTPYWVRVAAVIAPFLIGALFLYIWNRPGDANTLAATSPVIEYVEKVNPKGQKSTITLEDGTVVNLNADSKLIFKRPFDKEQRRVVLEGEAFFDVAKDSSRPFTIQTEDIATTVLGTSFNIRAYKGAGEILVAVASGKVKVEKVNRPKDEPKDEPLLLVPNEMGRYSAMNNKIEKTSFDPTSLFGWKEGVIYFKDANFKEVRERLEQWYGVTFLIEKSIDSKRDFTGTYKNKSLSTVLEGMSFVYDFEFEINDKLVIIK